jgi:hypothetical protein
VLQYLEQAANCTPTRAALNVKFPDVLLANNPTLEDARTMFNLTIKAGRKPRLILQVRAVAHACRTYSAGNEGVRD